MSALEISYDGCDYVLDLEDMDDSDARAMERHGVPNLKALEDGVAVGDLKALTVTYWLMLKQSGADGARLERVKIKPVKFIRALGAANEKAAAAQTVEAGKAETE